MNFPQFLAKARAARRAGYKMRELDFGQNLDLYGNIVWDGQMYERSTGREICPFALAPVEVLLGRAGQPCTITTFQKNSNNVVGVADTWKGETV